MQISRCPGVTTHPPFSSAGLTGIIRPRKRPHVPGREHTVVVRGHEPALALLYLQA